MALIGGTWFEKKKIKIKLMMLEGTLICDMKMCNRKIVWLFFFLRIYQFGFCIIVGVGLG